MFSSLRNHFGIPGVIAVIALVFAMIGGAYAATGGNPLAKSSKQKKSNAGLTAKQKKEVKEIAKGAPGPQGPAGSNGSAGSAGGQGPIGPQGVQGVPGTPGAKGDAGNPWAVGGTLPEKATLIGTYSADSEETTFGALGAGSLNKEETALSSASFSLAVESSPTFHFVPGSSANANGYGTDEANGCPGVDAEGVPQAESGTFCVYGYAGKIFGGSISTDSATVASKNPSLEDSETVSPGGTILKMTCPTGALNGICYARGLWAVTG